MLKKLPTVVSLLLSVASTGFLVFTPSQTNAADLQSIKQRGRLIVAVKDNLRPLGYRNPEGNLQGFEIDLAQRLATELLGRSNSVELKPVSNQERFTVVLNGEVDITIAKVTLTPSRPRILSFSVPYYRDGAILATQDPAIRTMNDLAGKSVAILRNSSTVEAVRRKFPQVSLVGVNSYQEAKQAIETGQASAVAADASVLAGWVQEFPQYRILPEFLSVEPLCVILPKGQQYRELRDAIDQILTRLRSTGWLEERANYWGLPRNLSF